MTVVLKQLEQFVFQSLPSSQESGCTHHCLCLTKLNLDNTRHPQNLHHFREYPDSKRCHGPLRDVANKAQERGREYRFGSWASWGGPWEGEVQGKKSHSLEHVWVEEGRLQGRRAGGSAQSHRDTVK